LVEALVVLSACTASSVSCTGGSSVITCWVEEAAAASLFGSSSSLQEEIGFIQLKRKNANTVKFWNSQNTYDARRSKNSTSSSRTGASLAAVLWTEVLDEVSSSTCFLFLSAPVSSERAGGDDVVELVSSSNSLASSLSWFSLASGASEIVEARSAERGPSSRRGGRETRNWWSYKWISQKSNRYKHKHRWKLRNLTTSIQYKKICKSQNNQRLNLQPHDPWWAWWGS
jgi:hypothetical protein